MAKEDNLIPFTSEQSREEAKINGKKGGIRSGEVRREKATFKKTLEGLLDEEYIKKGKSTGKTYRELILLGQVTSAIKGKAENFKAILALMGEMEEEQTNTPEININIVDNSELEKIMYEDNN